MQPDFSTLQPDTSAPASSGPDFGSLQPDFGSLTPDTGPTPEDNGNKSSLSGMLFSNTGPTFKASMGGAESIVPNIAKTFGNIPSSTRNLVRGAIAPVNPFDTNSPVNIGKNVTESAKDVYSIFKNRGLKGGLEDIASGVYDTVNKGVDMWKGMGQSIYDNLEKNAVYSEGGALDNTYFKGLDISAAEGLSKILKIGIEDPTAIPAAIYAGPKVTEAGATTDAISELAQGTKNVIKKAVSPVAKVTDPLIEMAQARNVDKLEQTYQELAGSTTKTKKVLNKGAARTEALNKAGTEGVNPERVLAENGIIPKQSGTKLDTIEQAQKFKDDTFKFRDANRAALKEVEYGVPQTPIEMLKERAISLAKSEKNIANGTADELVSRIEKDAVNYTKNYGEKIPLTKVDDIRAARFGKVKNFADPVGGDVDYLWGKAAQKTIEETAQMGGFDDVAQLNRVMGDRFEAAKFLESLDGKTLKGGGLTKLAFKTMGFTAGATLPGKVLGAIGGDIVANTLISNSVAGPIKRLILKNLAVKDPEAYTATLKWLEEQGKLQELRLALPASGGSSATGFDIAPTAIPNSGSTVYDKKPAKSFNQTLLNIQDSSKLLPERAGPIISK